MTDDIIREGYPTEEALDAIAVFEGTPHELVESLLEPIFRGYGFAKVEDGQTHYGVPAKLLTLVTGGWSGNESAIGALRKCMLWFVFWEASHRGGKYDFVIPTDRWDRPMLVMPWGRGTCRCGHSAEEHDTENGTPLCRVHGDNTHCDYADDEEIAADRWDEGWIAAVGALSTQHIEEHDRRLLWILEHMPKGNPYRENDQRMETP